MHQHQSDVKDVLGRTESIKHCQKKRIMMPKLFRYLMLTGTSVINIKIKHSIGKKCDQLFLR